MMANQTSGMLAAVMLGTPPLSPSEVDPTNPRTFGMRSATSAALVEEFCPSSSTSSASLRPQIPPAALTAANSACTPWGPCGNEPVRGPVIPLTFPKLIDVGVTPVSDAVLPVVPVHRAASAEGAKLNPAEVAVADDAGGLVAPAAPVAAAPLAVRTAGPEPTDPADPPSACAGVLHGAVVVVVVVVDADPDFGFVVVVVEPDADAPAAVVVVAADEHGTVVALPAACATPFASVPPPAAPR